MPYCRRIRSLDIPASMTEIIEFYGKAFRAMLGLSLTRTYQNIQAAQHRWYYQETVNPKKIVIIGGSYAGAYLAQRLSETLPTGYKAVLVERNTHFNHLFVFPRFGVIPGKEHMAFIPYDGLSRMGPPGIFEHVHDSAASITGDTIQLSSGKSIEYDYLALATGTWQPPPSKASSTKKSEACAELRASQSRIQDAKKIAVIGGGPVGVQIATDISSFFPDKNVTLIHSRAQLLPKFGPRLHEHTLEVLKGLNVDVVLGERPEMAASNGNTPTVEGLEKSTLAFKDGRKVNYDLIIRCTGQRPKSALLESFVPSATCPKTRQILVRPTLQIEDPSHQHPRVFALGDVASTHGPRMARSARAQADVVTSNILAMIKQQEPSTNYVPQLYESLIKLTLGKDDYVWYGKNEKNVEIMVKGKLKDEALDVGHAWAGLASKFEPTLD